MSAHSPSTLGTLGQGQAPHAAVRGVQRADEPDASETSAAQPPDHSQGEPHEDSLREPLTQPVSFTLTVPATSANLGPGYDAMGLALELRDTVTVHAHPREDPAKPSVSVAIEGEGAADLPSDASHLVVTVMEKIMAAKGYHLPDIDVHATNVIPHSRGLGSSAAAIASAVITADQLIPGGLSDHEKLQIGSRIEGHPDNYVPALRGGVAVSWDSDTDGGEAQYRSAAIAAHAQVRCVVAVPGFVQSTQAAREVLPGSVPHDHAARNSARAALLVHAITHDPALLFEATEDYLHQEYRRQAFPASMHLVDVLRTAGHAAVISGAGPAVLVLTTDSAADEVAAVITAHCAEAPEDQRFIPRNLPIATAGVTVEASQ